MNRFCVKCGNMLSDDMQFCSRCGEKIINTNYADNIAEQMDSAVYESDMNEPYGMRDINEQGMDVSQRDFSFIDPDENIAVRDQFSGLFKKSKLYVTDKHFYYEFVHKIFRGRNKFIVPVQDITASDVVYTKNYAYLFLSLLCFMKIIVEMVKNSFMQQMMYELYNSDYTAEAGSGNGLSFLIGIIFLGLFIFVKHVKFSIYFPGGKKTFMMHVDDANRVDILHRKIRQIVEKNSKENADSNTGVSNS